MRGPCASLLLRATDFRSRPDGTFGNSLADSASFRFPFRSTLSGFPLFQQGSRTVLAFPAGWSEVKAEEGEDGTLSTFET